VARARVADLVSRAGSFSIRIDGWKSDLAGVLANKRAVVSGIVGLSGIPGPRDLATRRNWWIRMLQDRSC
jgi:hypothetical protein